MKNWKFRGYLSFILIATMLFACTKEEPQTETPTIINNTIISSVRCYTETFVGYTAAGDEITRFENFYTDTRLDSTYNYSYGVLGSKTIYTYNSPYERIADYISLTGPDAGYLIETLNEHGYVIESKLYNASGDYLSRSTWAFNCE